MPPPTCPAGSSPFPSGLVSLPSALTGLSGATPTAEAQPLAPPPPSTSATLDVTVRSACDASDSSSLHGQLGTLSIATPPPALVPHPANPSVATA
eukprot:3134329-Prymnesium_polylepis.1